MREAIFILLVVVVLLALTVIRYRKQIAGMIALGRMVKHAKRSGAGARIIPEGDRESIALVNCSKCDVWVPQGKTVKFREGFVCAEACLKAVSQKN